MNTNNFEEIKALHPTWSDEQIWTAISLNMEADNVIEKKGANITMDDPDIFKEIITGAKNWLEAALPVIFEKVSWLFDQLLQNIASWIKKGWAYITDYIEKLWLSPSNPFLSNFRNFRYSPGMDQKNNPPT